MTKLKGKWFIGLLCLVILALSGGALALKTLSSKQQMPKELVILSPNSQTILTSTIPAFEEKYGIKVRLIQGG
ncbi:TPA: iron ABC transporter substrate-binding protein, partial [Streptococcus pyogenes]